MFIRFFVLIFQKQIKQKLTSDFMRLRNDFQSASGLAKQKLAQAAKNAKSSSKTDSSRQFDPEEEERALLTEQSARLDTSCLILSAG
jgi:hypothetical protein